MIDKLLDNLPIENGQNMMYRFQAEPEEQQEILENFMDYVELMEL
ncbi:MAG TPA: hypothetical protein PKY59_09500 [Pyrinomonadaceae bacterium]|nr:hypothetical protein [Pyrinomonadaceae bacterium]